MNDEQKIDDLCSRTLNPAVLNALHACRPEHPLGRDNKWKWRNAYSLVAQHTITFLHVDTDWLKQKALQETSAA